MNKRKVVSIRLNGEEKTYEEYSKKNNRKVLLKDFHSSLDELAATREKDEDNYGNNYNQSHKKKVVDLSTKQKEKRNLSLPFWDDGKRKKGPRMPPFGRKNKNNFSFTTNFIFHSLFLSVVAAILVGGALGMLLINVFTSNEDPTFANNNAQLVHDASSESPLAVTNDGVDKTFQIPPLEMLVLQEGAYSTMEKGQEAQVALKEEGIASVLYDDAEFTFLFMGVSHDQGHAESLSTYFLDRGKEVYLKPFELASGTINVNEEWQQFLRNGSKWMEEASSLSVKKMTGEPYDEGQLDNMTAQWNHSLQAVKENPTNTESLSLAEEWFIQSEHILETLENDGMSHSLAIDMQQVLLDKLILYEKLLASIGMETNS